MHEQNIKTLEELRRLIEPRKCIAFIGSGPSTGIFADWPTLINNLCEKCGLQVRVTDRDDANELLSLADAAQKQDEERYYAYLGSHFGRCHRTTPVYDLLMRIPFKSYVTLNLDPLLANETRKPEHRCSRVKKYPDLDRDGISQRTVYHLHGLIAEGEIPQRGSVVLSASDFSHAYRDNSQLLNFLLPTLTYDPILFVGCGLREPDFKRVFRLCQDHRDEILGLSSERGTPPSRIILLPRLPSVRSEFGNVTRRDVERERLARERAEDAYYSQYGIAVVRYPQVDAHHTGLQKWLEVLAGLPPLNTPFGFGQGEA